MSVTPDNSEDTLKELLIGILIFGVVAQLGGMFFVESILRYTVGLWIGIILVLACAYHMWWSINRNMTLNAGNEGAARTFAIKNNLWSLSLNNISLKYMLIVTFTNAAKLTSDHSPLRAFEIVYKKDDKEVTDEVTAVLDGDGVKLAYDEHLTPCAVRYLYENDPQHIDLYSEGLPVTPFKIDIE